MKYLPRIVDSEIKELMKIMGAVSVSGDVKYRISKEYVKALIYEEVKKVDGVKRNPEKMVCVLRSLARNIYSSS